MVDFPACHAFHVAFVSSQVTPARVQGLTENARDIMALSLVALELG